MEKSPWYIIFPFFFIFQSKKKNELYKLSATLCDFFPGLENIFDANIVTCKLMLSIQGSLTETKELHFCND